MKTKVDESYYNNGQLWYRFHVTTDGKRHGLYEAYYSDGSMIYICYWNMGEEDKLENYCSKYNDTVKIRYYI